jgi:two-component system cell cycle response regulator DivK
MAKILLVDDQPDNLEIYRAMLEHCGYAVHLASNGAEGVRMAMEHLPDLIVMDISMPAMDGFEATLILKSNPRTRRICIVGLTAHAMKSDRERVLSSGFGAYLAKPLEPRLLVREVEKLLGIPLGSTYDRLRARPPSRTLGEASRR